MKRIILILLCISLSFSIKTQVIPENRRVDWSVAGVNGDIPNPGTIVNVLNYGGVNNGSSDNKEAVVNAINSLNGEAGVIYFPEGAYMFNSGFSLSNNVVLRGDGPKSSLLLFLFSNGQDAINISGSGGSTGVEIISGNQMGDTQITVSNSSSFFAGDYAEITQTNGSWDTHPINWAVNAVGQIVKITEVVGNILTIENPLRLDYDLALSLTIRKIDPITNVGIENLGIETILDAGGAGNNISISYAADCWIKNIESNKSVGSHIYIGSSTNIEIRDSYIYDGFTFTGEGTRGYGVTLTGRTGECLIENNIFRKLRHAMIVKVGANGNVFGYNYSIEPLRIEPPSNAGGDISLHGHYPFSNLFEGNIVQNIMPDHAWGPSGPFNTFFRNRAELFGILMDQDTVDVSETTSKQNFVGNEVTNMIFYMGLYSLTGEDHFTYANNIKGTIFPSGTEELNDISYYLSSAPEYWNISDSWPSIGMPNSLNSKSIPAKERYIDMISGVKEILNEAENIIIYPNPVNNGSFMLKLGNNKFNRINLRIFNSTGSEVLNKSYNNYLNSAILIETKLRPGIYFVNIVTDNVMLSSKKLIIVE